MDLTLSRDSLLQGLKLAAAIARRVVTGDRVLFHNAALRTSERGATLEALGDDGCLSTRLDDTPRAVGGFAFNATLLARTVALLPCPLVTVAECDEKPGYARISSRADSGAEYAITIPTLPLDDFPVIALSAHEPPMSAAVVAVADLRRALRRVDRFRATDDALPVLRQYHLVSADGLRLDCYGSNGFALGAASAARLALGAPFPYCTLHPSALKLVSAARGETATIERLPRWLKLTIGETRAWFSDHDSTLARIDRVATGMAPHEATIEVERDALIRALTLADRASRYGMFGAANTYGVNLCPRADRIDLVSFGGFNATDEAAATLPARVGDGATPVAFDPALMLDALQACAPSRRVVLFLRGRSGPISVTPLDGGIGFAALIMPLHRHEYDAPAVRA